MVTSIWGRIKQAFRNSNRATGEGSGTYRASVTLSNAQMKTLRATPIEVVKGISGKLIVPIQIIAISESANVPRTGSVDVRLRWKDTLGTYHSASEDIDRTTMQGVDGNYRVAVEDIDIGSSGYFVGSGLYLQNPDSTEYGAGSDDNIVHFHIFYVILNQFIRLN